MIWGRYVETSAKGVTQLMMQRHPHGTKTSTTSPSSEKGIGSSVLVEGFLVNDREGAGDSCDALFCEHVDHGI